CGGGSGEGRTLSGGGAAAARSEKACQSRGLRAQTKAWYRWRAFGHGASAAMPRYHFHITNGRESLDNPKGMDLPGNAAARQEAVVLASELRHGKVKPGRDWQGLV